ncbi:MAG: hypothetical protein QOJ05_354 [Verrucomicrobiota bacterium]
MIVITIRNPIKCRPLVATALWAVSSLAVTSTQNQNGPQGRGYNL